VSCGDYFPNDHITCYDCKISILCIMNMISNVSIAKSFTIIINKFSPLFTIFFVNWVFLKCICIWNIFPDIRLEYGERKLLVDNQTGLAWQNPRHDFEWSSLTSDGKCLRFVNLHQNKPYTHVLVSEFIHIFNIYDFIIFRQASLLLVIVLHWISLL